MNSPLPLWLSGTLRKVAVRGGTYRLTIVPVAWSVPRSAPEAFDRVTVKVSSLSFRMSSSIATEIVLLVSLR